jgi:thiaminase
MRATREAGQAPAPVPPEAWPAHASLALTYHPLSRHRLKRPTRRAAGPPARLRLYARWIGTYGSPEFGAVVGAVLEATNEVAAQIGDAERAAMRRHFRTTSRYEWMFWDMGYRCEQWPFEDAPAAPRRPDR